jgi:hypothetical protein
MDAERRRLSLSLKRVEEGEPVRSLDGASSLGLSEEVFAEAGEAVRVDPGEPEGAAAEPADAEDGVPAQTEANE